jgi:hypothetical protein
MYHNSALAPLSWGCFFFPVPCADDDSPQRRRSLLLKQMPKHCRWKPSLIIHMIFTPLRFGIRNVTSIPDVLREAHQTRRYLYLPQVQQGHKSLTRTVRVFFPPLFLLPLLGWSFPDLWVSPRLYNQCSFSMIPLLGAILAGDHASYQYLVESIRRFPSQGDFARMIAEAGFAIGGDFEGDGGAWRESGTYGCSCVYTYRCETLEVSEDVRRPCFVCSATDQNRLPIQKIEATKCVRCKSKWGKSGQPDCTVGHGCDWMAVRETDAFRRVYSTTTPPASSCRLPPRLDYYRSPQLKTSN